MWFAIGVLVGIAATIACAAGLIWLLGKSVRATDLSSDMS